MSTWSKVAISVLIFFIGTVGGKTVFLLVKYFKFCKPFVNELIQFDIIDSRLKIQVLATEVFGPLVTFLIFNSICLIGCICVGTYASVAYGVSLFISIAIFPPPKDRYTMSLYNKETFIRRHMPCINVERLKCTYGYNIDID